MTGETRKRVWLACYSAFCGFAGWALAFWLWLESNPTLGFPRSSRVAGGTLLAGATTTVVLTALPLRNDREKAIRVAGANALGWLVGLALTPIVGGRSFRYVEDFRNTLPYFGPTGASIGAVLAVLLYLFVVDTPDASATPIDACDATSDDSSGS